MNVSRFEGVAYSALTVMLTCLGPGLFSVPFALLTAFGLMFAVTLLGVGKDG